MKTVFYFLVSSLLLIPGFCIAQFEHQYKIQPPDLSALDGFGTSVDNWNDLAIVSTGNDDDFGNNSGSASIYKWTGTAWVLSQKIFAYDAAPQRNFGYSVAVYNNFAAIGCKDNVNGTMSGSVYIYEFNGTQWVFKQKLLPADGKANDEFGNSLSMYEDYLATGANNYDGDSINMGAVYVFWYNGADWVQNAKLTVADHAKDDKFGSDVSIYKNYLIAGMPLDDDHGSASGSAFIFSRIGNNWIERTKLSPVDGNASDNFGYSVSINDDYAFCSAYKDDDIASDCGSVYVYLRCDSVWNFLTRLMPDGAADYVWFGISMEADSNYLTVGAMNKNGGKGSVYVFSTDGTNWTKVKEIVASDGMPLDNLGSSVSVYGQFIITGAGGDDFDSTGVSNSGSVYLFGPCAPPAPTVVLINDTLFSDALSGNQWYDSNGALPGETNNYFAPAAAGNYFVIVTENSCVSDSSNIVFFTPLALTNYETAWQTGVFPNPANDMIYIKCNGNLFAELINVYGQTIRKLQTSDSETIISLSDIKPGVYFIKINSAGRATVKKIIKQ